MLLPSATRAVALALILPCAFAQLSSLIYTYQGQSVPASVLQAISSAAAPAISILNSVGTDTATALVGAFPTTATVLPVSAPTVTGSPAFSSGQPGEVLSTNTRPPFVASGTLNVSAALGTTGASATSKSAASRTGDISLGLGFGAIVSTLVGLVVGVGMTL